ncbi:MAG: hypothetical protein MRY78_19420 [Saprospiraceae bacterium]|nr:hypothetical protein [Saprospiraceae bacterium]
MGFIEDVKHRFYHTAVQRELRQMPARIRSKTINLQTAQSVGILFDANQMDNRKQVLQYAQSLEKQKKKTHLLGYLETVAETDLPSFPYFTKKEINWKYLPKGEEVQKFIAAPFDLLLHLHPQPNLTTNYIAALSKAPLRVGPYTTFEPAYDLMIDIPEDTNVKILIQQIENLLAKIKNKNEAA